MNTDTRDRLQEHARQIQAQAAEVSAFAREWREKPWLHREATIGARHAATLYLTARQLLGVE